MYRKLENVIFEKRILKKELADKMDMNYNTLLSKLNGRSAFTFDEAVLLKKILEVDITVEELFDKSA